MDEKRDPVPERALDATSAVRAAVARALGEVTSLRRVTRMTMRALQSKLGEASVGVALREGEAWIPVWATEDRPGRAFKRRRGSLWRAVEGPQSVPASRPGKPRIFPIQGEDRLLGLIIGRSDQDEAYQILEAAAAELSAAAMRLQEVVEAHRLNREVAVLYHVAKALSTPLDLQNILMTAMQGVWELFDVQGAFLVLLAHGDQDVAYRVPLTGEPYELKPYEGDPRRGITGDCITHSATALVEDAAHDPRFDPQMDGLPGLVVRSLLCVPLLARERSLGAITLLNKREPPFTRHDLGLLETLAASVGAAIDNARLFEELSAANTDLRKSKDEVERSRFTLITIFDNLDDELYIVDRQWRIVAVNRARAERAGYGPHGLVGRVCYRALMGRKDPCPACRAGETFSQGSKTQRIERVEETGRGMVEREIYTYPILDRGGEVIQTILQLRDVTEQRRLEASLAQAEKLAALGQLAAGVAHELTNPLTAVIGNAQFMRRQVEGQPEYQEALELIEQAGHRAHKVVRDLLDFARQESPSMQVIQVNGSIEQALALMQGQWKKAGITLRVELAPELPPVYGNADQLQTVWLNLLLNARDALRGQPGEVWVRSFDRDGWVVVQVSDTGVGIPPEQHARIFEPFFTTKAPGKGTGLGLSTSYRVVEHHNGRILVDSAPGQGATFSVELPALQDQGDAGERGR